MAYGPVHAVFNPLSFMYCRPQLAWALGSVVEAQKAKSGNRNARQPRAHPSPHRTERSADIMKSPPGCHAVILAYSA
jgi:hypothetical protein